MLYSIALSNKDNKKDPALNTKIYNIYTIYNMQPRGQNLKFTVCIKLPKLMCIRPPQSQSGTDNFLKTSLCADGSKHLHELNRINSCHTKSVRTFFFK